MANRMAGDIFKSAQNDRMNYVSDQNYDTDNFEPAADTQPQEAESDVPDTEAVTTPDAAAPTPAGDAEVSPAVMPQENSDRMIRTNDFRDANGNGTDDRDEYSKYSWGGEKMSDSRAASTFRNKLHSEAMTRHAAEKYMKTRGLGKTITKPSEMTDGLDMPNPPQELLANVSKYTQGLLKKSGKATPENNSGRYYGMPE